MLTEKLKTLSKALNESDSTEDVIKALNDVFRKEVKVFVFDSRLNTFRDFAKHWTVSNVLDADINDLFDGIPVIKNNHIYYPAMKKKYPFGLSGNFG